MDPGWAGTGPRTRDRCPCGGVRHLGTDPCGRPASGGRKRRRRPDRIGGPHRLPGPPACRPSREEETPGRADPDEPALGRSRDGLSTKVHLAGDTVHDHWPSRQRRPGGRRPGLQTVMAAIRVPRCGPGNREPDPGTVLANRAYSSRAIRIPLRRRGIPADVPQPSDQIGHRLRRGRAGGRPPVFDVGTARERVGDALPWIPPHLHGVVGRLGQVSGRGLAAFPSREDALRAARDRRHDRLDPHPEGVRADPSLLVRPPGAGALGTLSPGRREAALSVGSARVAS